MSKEEILEKRFPAPDSEDTNSILSAMDEHAQQVAVAYNKWHRENNWEWNIIQHYWQSDIIEEYFTSDGQLYQYFIDNVYNK